MPFTARIFRLLESELNKNLVFSFSIVKNLTHPGTRQIRVNDRFEVRVTVRNQCSLALKNVRGSIQPTSISSFAPTRFELASLGGHADTEVARIQARIVKPVTERSVFDQLATVNVAGQADLSEFWFHDANRPLPYAQPTAGATRVTDRDRPIALAPRRRESAAPTAERKRSRWLDVLSTNRLGRG